MMTAAEIRLKQNPILSSLLLGMGQGTMIAEMLMPRLPQALSSVTLAQAGDAVTDESSAMELSGLSPLLVQGSAQNFKVTYPADFALAQSVLLARTA
jgi:hypothetical protein